MQRFQTFDAVAEGMNGVPPRPVSPDLVSRGDRTTVLVRAREGLSWKPSVFGMPFREPGKASHLTSARVDALKVVERWCLLVNRRFVVPLRGYRWLARGDWVSVAPSWMAGFHEGDGTVCVSAAGGSAPVLLDAAAALTWLEAPSWEVVPMLERAPACAG